MYDLDDVLDSFRWEKGKLKDFESKITNLVNRTSPAN